MKKSEEAIQEEDEILEKVSGNLDGIYLCNSDDHIE